jgi:hypothetical protein
VGEDTNRIEREIRTERQQLGRNLTELEMKAKQLADWRTYYRSNPKLLLGIALGGGLILGALAGRAQHARRDYASEPVARLPRSRGRAGAQIEETWQSISDALLGVASAKVIEFVSNVIPGFSDQLNRRPIGAGPDRGRAGISAGI